MEWILLFVWWDRLKYLAWWEWGLFLFVYGFMLFLVLCFLRGADDGDD